MLVVWVCLALLVDGTLRHSFGCVTWFPSVRVCWELNIVLGFRLLPCRVASSEYGVMFTWNIFQLKVVYRVQMQQTQHPNPTFSKTM